MDISIALCTYNGEEYLSDQLDSILTQTLPPNEIVVRDDGSDDATIDILRQYKRKNPGIFDIKINDRNRGVRRNFESAIKACSGRYIALSDQDDIWHQKKLEKQHNALEETNVALACHNSKLVTKNGREIGNLWTSLPRPFYPSDDIDPTKTMKELVTRNFIQGATVMLDASWVEQLLPISENWGKDHYLGVQTTLRTGIVTLPEQLIDYRQHNDQVMGGPDNGFRSRIKKAIAGEFLNPKPEKWEELAHWVGSHKNASMAPEKDEILPIIQEKVKYERQRSQAVDGGLVRGGYYIIRNYLNGNYDKFGTGMPRAVNDLLLLMRS